MSCRSIQRRAVVFAVSTLLALTGCDQVLDTSEHGYLERARTYHADGNVTAALVELKNALAKDPDSVAAHTLLARLYIEAGDGVTAEKELSRARELGASVDDIIVLMGRAWLAQRNYEQVLRGVFRDQVSDARKAEALLVRAEAMLGMGQHIEAEDGFRSALRYDGTLALAYAGLARALTRREDRAGADAALARALELAPDDPDVLMLKGDFQFVAGDYEAAEETFKAVVKARAYNPSSFIGLVRVQIGLEKYAEAKANLARMFTLSPDNPEANYLSALAAYQIKDYAAAKFHIDRVLLVSETHLPSLLVAGATGFALGEYEQASRLLRRFVRAVPGFVPGRKLLAAALLRMAQHKDAYNVLRPLEGKDESDAELLSLIGASAAGVGDYKMARAYYQRAIDLKPERVDTRIRLGYAKIALGDQEEGVADLDLAFESDPTHPAAIFAKFRSHMQAREFDQAIALAERLSEASPADPWPRNLIGVAAVAMAETSRARFAFQKALELSPGYPPAALNLAIMSRRAGDRDTERSYYAEILNHDPQHLATLLALAKLEVSLGKLDDARSVLKRAVNAHPKAIEPRVVFSRVLLSMNLPSEVVLIASEALVDHGDHPGLLDVLGRAHLMLDNAPAALEQLVRLERLLPERVDTHFLLATAYGKTGDEAMVRAHLGTVLRLAPDHRPARVSLARLALDERDFTTAERLIGQLANAAADDPEVQELQGTFALLRQDYAGAITYLGKARTRLLRTDVVLKLASAYWAAGHRSDAVATLDEWLERAPTDLGVRVRLGNYLIAMDALDRARIQYDIVVTGDPDGVAARNNLAWVLLRMNRPDQALPHAEQAHALAPDNAGVKDTLGLVYLAKGATDRGLAMLREAAAGLPDNPAVQLHLAQALAQAGQTAEARRVLRTVLARPDPFEDRAAAQALLRQLGS